MMEIFSKFVLSEDGTIRTIKVLIELALKEIDEILEENKEFLGIMEKCSCECPSSYQSYP